jgi:hypothetical protein
VAFSADTNTGVYRAGADTVGFAAGGVEWAQVSADVYASSVAGVGIASTTAANIGVQIANTAAAGNSRLDFGHGVLGTSQRYGTVQFTNSDNVFKIAAHGNGSSDAAELRLQAGEAGSATKATIYTAGTKQLEILSTGAATFTSTLTATAGTFSEIRGSAASLSIRPNTVTVLDVNTTGVIAYQNFTAPLYKTTTNCTDGAGAAACTAAPAGSVVIDAAATTVVVSTTAVTANSQVFVMEDSSLTTRLGIGGAGCNSTTGRTYTVSARTAATSFTITSSAAPVTNPACLSYFIVN